MSKNLLFEVGTEELPARFIEPALESMQAFAEKTLKDLELTFEYIKTAGTCRRLTLFVGNLAERQRDREEEILGPSYQVALDEKGNYTPALLGFAKRHNLSPEELYVKETPKGKYFCAKKIIKGKETKELLGEFLLDLMKNIYFPKRMRWGTHDFAFGRPIRWLLALYGDEVVPLEVAQIKSGAFTFGHRYLAPHKLFLSESSWEVYKNILRDNYVIVDVEERLQKTKESIIEKSFSFGKPLLEEALLKENAHLVEYPFPTIGHFPEKFLKLPPKLITTALQEHQRYFIITNEGGDLLPYFVAVNNNRPRDEKILIKGHERVAKARLEDAFFYYERDLKIPLIERVEKLKGMVYHIKCGTLYDKTERLIELAKFLKNHLFPSLPEERVYKACLYAKADLATEVVKEFPSLQGYMGSHYLSLEGEKDIAPALYEQYLPHPQEEIFPETEYGIILSLADKIDHICALYGVGERVTGEGDPYALRRAAYGIIKILIEKGLDLELEPVINFALSLLEKQGFLRNKEALAEIVEFFKRRLEGEFLNMAFGKNFIYVIINQPLNPYEHYLKLIALREIYTLKEFQDLMILFKRVTQILKNISLEELPEVNPQLFQLPAERTLWDILLKHQMRLQSLLQERNYRSYLETLLYFKTPIDQFFEEVFVMVEDKDLRNNRLSLLKEVAEYFYSFGDLSYLA